MVSVENITLLPFPMAKWLLGSYYQINTKTASAVVLTMHPMEAVKCTSHVIKLHHRFVFFMHPKSQVGITN